MNGKTIPPPRSPMKNDSAAESEAEEFQSGGYEAAAAQSAHNRSERIKWHMGCAAVWLFWLLVAAVIALAFSWLWSILMPAKFQYLTEPQLSQVRTLLTSALLVKFITEFSKKNFS